MLFLVLVLLASLHSEQQPQPPAVPTDTDAMEQEIGKLAQADRKLWFIANALPLSVVFDGKHLGDALGGVFVIDPSVDPNRRISLLFRDATVRSILVDIADRYEILYEVTGTNVVTVRRRER